MAVPSLILALTALLSSAQADTGSACDNWGAVEPDTLSLITGTFVTFRIGGGPACGDTSSCSWWADGDRGDFMQSTGSPVTWRAPTELEDCISQEFRVWASCTDGSTTGWADVTVRCSYTQLEEVQKTRSATLTGGGCSGPPTLVGPTEAGVLLLLPALGLLRRRRR